MYIQIATATLRHLVLKTCKIHIKILKKGKVSCRRIIGLAPALATSSSRVALWRATTWLGQKDFTVCCRLGGKTFLWKLSFCFGGGGVLFGLKLQFDHCILLRHSDDFRCYSIKYKVYLLSYNKFWYGLYSGHLIAWQHWTFLSISNLDSWHWITHLRLVTFNQKDGKTVWKM